MKNIIKVCSLLSLFSASATYAASLDVDINNDAIRGQFNVSDANAKLGLSAAVMATDDDGEVYSFTARTQGILAKHEMIKGGFGGRAYYVDPDDGDNFQSLGIGGYIDVTVPELKDLTLGVEIFYAPSITTSNDIDNLKEISFRASYQLFENASAYLGLRHIEAEKGNVDYKIEEGVHLGFSLQF